MTEYRSRVHPARQQPLGPGFPASPAPLEFLLPPHPTEDPAPPTLTSHQAPLCTERDPNSLGGWKNLSTISIPTHPSSFTSRHFLLVPCTAGMAGGWGCVECVCVCVYTKGTTKSTNLPAATSTRASPPLIVGKPVCSSKTHFTPILHPHPSHHLSEYGHCNHPLSSPLSSASFIHSLIHSVIQRQRQ